MSSTEVKNFDSLTTLDDIDDLPTFATFPTGSYHVVCDDGIERKVVNDKQVATINLRLVETLEMTGTLDQGEAPPKPGDIESFMFQLDNETGQGFYKQVLKALADKLGTKEIKPLEQNSKGINFLIVQKRTFNKEKDRNFANIKKIATV